MIILLVLVNNKHQDFAVLLSKQLCICTGYSSVQCWHCGIVLGIHTLWVVLLSSSCLFSMF